MSRPTVVAPLDGPTLSAVPDNSFLNLAGKPGAGYRIRFG